MWGLGVPGVMGSAGAAGAAGLRGGAGTHARRPWRAVRSGARFRIKPTSRLDIVVWILPWGDRRVEAPCPSASPTRCPRPPRSRANIFVMTEFRALHQDIRPLRGLHVEPHANQDRHGYADHAQAFQHAAADEVESCCARAAMKRRTCPTSAWRRSTARSTRCATKHYDGSIDHGRSCRPLRLLRMSTIGTSSWTSWIRPPPTCTPRCIFAGVRRRGCSTTTASTSTNSPPSSPGVYEHVLEKPSSPLVRGLDDRFFAVHSRYTGVGGRSARASRARGRSEFAEAGLYLVKSVDSRRFFVFGHAEYDADTLRSNMSVTCGRASTRTCR